MSKVHLEVTMMKIIGELKAENARLKAEVDNLRKSADINTDKSTHELSRLKAEVERLTAFTTRTIIPNEELQAQVSTLQSRCDFLEGRGL